jgi:Flp pilus assembly pilin Flp
MTSLLAKMWQVSPRRAGRGGTLAKAIAKFQTATQAPFCGRLLRDQRGQDFTEYALIGGLVSCIAVGMVPQMLSIGGHINEVLLSAVQAAADITTLK